MEGFPDAGEEDDEEEEVAAEDLNENDKPDKENSHPNVEESSKDCEKAKTEDVTSAALKEKSNSSEVQIVDRLNNLQVCDEKDTPAS